MPSSALLPMPSPSSARAAPLPRAPRALIGHARACRRARTSCVREPHAHAPCMRTRPVRARVPRPCSCARRACARAPHVHRLCPRSQCSRA
eukprot:434845-Pleurochrysis_carterae.AAC.1